MTPEQISEVWTMLDRDKLAEIARRGYDPVFATVSGAHLYGFASKDSDVDLRGAFLIPAHAMLGLYPPQETESVAGGTDGLDLDWVGHDLRKFARMLSQGNGYVLEQLYSPLVVIETPAFLELRERAKGCITRPTIKHYLGFANGRLKRLGEPDATVKHLLYAYRVLMSGLHAVRHGAIEANLVRLLDGRPDVVNELIERKRSGTETEVLRANENAFHTTRLRGLLQALEQAFETTTLAERPAPACVAGLEDLVVSTRLAR